MKFNYQSRTKNGEVRAGEIEASSKVAAIALLKRKGMYVTFLEEAKAPAYAKEIKLFERISQKEIVLFSRQLAIMFKSKIPLVESLQVLSMQAKGADFQEKIVRLSEDIEGGTVFSKALSRYPKIFSPFYIAMVKSGEISGKLSEVLNYLADHLEREYHLKSKIRGAMVYPFLILFVVFLVLLLMVYFVIPQLTGVLVASGQSLPLATKIVIALSNFLRSWGWLVILSTIGGIIFLSRYYATENGKAFFDRIFLKLPIIGPFMKMLYVSRFAENLSTLISGGLPIAQALETVADIIGSAPYKEDILKARDEVRKGVPISSVLSKSEYFPPIFVQMILVGEKTGSLDSTLMNIVNFYQRETERSIDSLLSILEPALILGLGIIVAVLMLSILMPLYRMVSL